MAAVMAALAALVAVLGLAPATTSPAAPRQPPRELAGHVVVGPDDSTFTPCGSGEGGWWVRISSGARRTISWPKRPWVATYPRYFVRWRGTVSAPGKFGPDGTRRRRFTVESVVEIRNPAEDDCRDPRDVLRIPLGGGGPEILARVGRFRAWGAIAISRDGLRAASQVSNDSVAIWDMTTGARLAQVRTDPEGRGPTVGSSGPSVMALSPDGSLLVVRGPDGIARVFDAATGAERWALGRAEEAPPREGRLRDVLAPPPPPVAPYALAAVGFAADGREIVTALRDGTIARWSASTGRAVEVARVRADTGRAQWEQIALSADGRVAALVGGAGLVRLWSLAEGHVTDTVRLDTGAVQDVSVAAGALASSGGFRREARVWAKATGRTWVVPRAGDLTRVVRLSDDGTRLAHGDGGGLLTIYDVATGRKLRELRARGGIMGLAFIRGGAMLAVADDFSRAISVVEP